MPRNTTPTPSRLGPLHTLLTDAFPHMRTPRGVLDVRELAVTMDMTYQGVYKWFTANKLPPDRAKQLVGLSRGRLSLTKLEPYVFG